MYNKLRGVSMISPKLFLDKTIIITKQSIKNELLLYINNLGLIDIKVLNKHELLSDITFTYTSDVLQYMYSKYGKSLDVCKTLLNNLYYINSTNTCLNSIKQDLIDNKKLFECASIIPRYKTVIFYDINLDPFFEKKIKEISSSIEILKISSNLNDKNKSYIYEASDINNEVMYFFDKCYEFIKSGIDINNIKLIIPDDEYYSYLEYYSNLYNINICLNKRNSLYSYGITLKLLESYRDGKSLEKIVKHLSYNSNPLVLEIINIINKYDYKKDIYDLLVYEFKNTFVGDLKSSNSIEVIDINDNYIDSSMYLFILGFNQNLIPVINKDDDYFKDSEKEVLGLYTSTFKNKLEAQEIINIIRKSKETYISYKLKTPFNTYIKSSLLDNMYLIQYNYKHDYSVSPSVEFDKDAFSSMIDDLYKYNKSNDDLDLLLANVDNDFGKYDNRFSGLNNDTLEKLLGNELKLSYTSINSYYECAYKYYLKYLLKIKEESTNLNALFLGNLFHYVLSKVFLGDSDIHSLIYEYLESEEKELSVSDNIYLKKYEIELKLLVDLINENRNRSHFKDLYYEKEIEIYNDKKIKVTLTGKIDKVLSFNDGEFNYLIIIDYKTGNLKVDYNNIVYGLNMQLFMYAYFMNKGNIIPNSKIAGFYLQNIGHDLLKREDSKSLDEIIKGEYKLYGYSTENIDIIKKFDNDLSSLKNLKLKSDGTFSSNSLVFSDTLLDKFLDIVDDKIKGASDNILSGNFEINPKEIDGKNVSCCYCKYFDICYRKSRDIKALEKQTIDEYVSEVK